MKPQTVAALSGRSKKNGGPVTPPIAIANAYGFDDIESYDGVEAGTIDGHTYSRDGSPTSDLLEAAVASLEKGEAAAAVTAGMAAITTTMLALLPQRGTVVTASDVFGGTNLLLREVLEPLGFDIRWVDFMHVDDVASTMSKLATVPTVVLCESISNPRMRVPDLPGLAEIAHRNGATFVVDNTFATPWFCQPLTLGADVVLHSASKYLSGHADVVGGVVVGPAPVIDHVRRVAIRTGARLDPFGSWLTLRGLRTLPLRMRESAANAVRVADLLTGHPAVERVLYPGLEINQRTDGMLKDGYGSMVSFVLRGGLPAARRFVKGLEMIRFVGSLGDVATSVSHPATTSHRSLSQDERRERDIDDGLIRVSVGIEDADDILNDLSRGLNCLATV